MLKILVIDDNEAHRKSAIQTLQGHHVVVRDNYDDALEILEVRHGRFEESPMKWDVVLVDLLMPGGQYQQARPRLTGEEAMGFPLALLAAQRGVKLVGVVSDGNHHSHPACAALDFLSGFGKMHPEADSLPTTFTINGSKVGFFHAPMVEVEGKWVKDWGRVLTFLTTGA